VAKERKKKKAERRRKMVAKKGAEKIKQEKRFAKLRKKQ
jgi:hypothetical protein